MQPRVNIFFKLIPNFKSFKKSQLQVFQDSGIALLISNQSSKVCKTKVCTQYFQKTYFDIVCQSHNKRTCACMSCACAYGSTHTESWIHLIITEIQWLNLNAIRSFLVAGPGCNACWCAFSLAWWLSVVACIQTCMCMLTVPTTIGGFATRI